MNIKKKIIKCFIIIFKGGEEFLFYIYILRNFTYMLTTPYSYSPISF